MKNIENETTTGTGRPKFPETERLLATMTAGLDGWYYARRLAAAKRRNAAMLALTVCVLTGMVFSARAAATAHSKTNSYTSIYIGGAGNSTPDVVNAKVDLILNSK